MAYLRSILAALFLVVVLTAFYDWSLNFSVRLIGFEPPAGAPAPRPIILDVVLCSVAMLAGITFGTVYEAIKDRKSKVNIFRELLRAIESPRLVVSVVLAPLLFAGVYSAARAEPDVVIALVFAFQNGFFCDRIVRVGDQSNSP